MRSAFKPADPVENLETARREIAQDELPTRLQHAQHFLEHPHRAFQMVKGVHAGHGVEAGARPRQVICIVNDKPDPAAVPRLADVELRRPLLFRVNVQCRYAIHMLRQCGEEAAPARADFQHVSGQRQGFCQNELEAGGRIVSETAKQGLALPHRAASFTDGMLRFRHIFGTTLPMNARRTNLNHVQTEAHPFCVVCSQSNPMGFGLKFTSNDDGSVSAAFLGHPGLEGFQGLLHGGVIASLLDGAMTNCMFARGCVAMTAEFKVRYHKPVVVGEEMFIRAWVTGSQPPLHQLQAELKQEGCVKAFATAKFIERHE